jgi:hypothetical protein
VAGTCVSRDAWAAVGNAQDDPVTITNNPATAGPLQVDPCRRAGQSVNPDAWRPDRQDPTPGLALRGEPVVHR